MASSYKLGLTQGGMVTLDTLIAHDPHPQPAHYSGHVRAGDGLSYGVGEKVAEWRWAKIDVADVAVLRGYCADVSGTVYIQTPDIDGDFDQFSALVEWPQAPEAFIGDFFEDFALKFYKLVKLTGST